MSNVESQFWVMVGFRTSQAQLMSSAGTKGRDLIRWNEILMSEPSDLYSGTRSKREKFLHSLGSVSSGRSSQGQ